MDPLKAKEGIAPPSDKILWKGLRAKGISEKKMPLLLQNAVVKQGKKGPLGAIQVRRMTGVTNNTASRTLRRFEDNVGGKDDVAEKLEAVQDRLTKEQIRLLELLKLPSKKGLVLLTAESGAEPVALMKAYATGCIELGKLEAAMEAHRNLPSIIKQLYKDALDRSAVCMQCGGTGTLHLKSTDHKESKSCQLCQGSGIISTSSDHKEFAITKIMEATKLIGKEPPQVNVTTQIGVKVGGSRGSFMEKMVQVADEVLYGRGPTIVDGEVLSSSVKGSN
jgi:hypothetical protein